MNANDVISKDTVHRIVHDVKDMLTNSLKSHGIYYKHDEDDMLKGEEFWTNLNDPFPPWQ